MPIMELESFFSLGDHLEKAGQGDNTLGLVSQWWILKVCAICLGSDLAMGTIRKEDVLLLIR